MRRFWLTLYLRTILAMKKPVSYDLFMITSMAHFWQLWIQEIYQIAVASEANSKLGGGVDLSEIKYEVKLRFTSFFYTHIVDVCMSELLLKYVNWDQKCNTWFVNESCPICLFSFRYVHVFSYVLELAHSILFMFINFKDKIDHRLEQNLILIGQQIIDPMRHYKTI